LPKKLESLHIPQRDVEMDSNDMDQKQDLKREEKVKSVLHAERAIYT